MDVRNLEKLLNLTTALVVFCSGSTGCFYGPLIVNELPPPDTGAADAGQTDAGRTDAGQTDAGQTDAGQMDAGGMDGSALDTGEMLDGGGVSDAGATTDASPLALPMTVDDHFPDRSLDGEGFMATHAEDGGCLRRAGGEAGSCHRVQWDASRAFTSSYWTVGAAFEDLRSVPIEMGAVGVSFYAWGSTGGEEIHFGAGIGAGYGPMFDTAEDRQIVLLTTMPQRYTVEFVSLDGFTAIHGAFFFQAFADRNPRGFEIYIDDIQWVR